MVWRGRGARYSMALGLTALATLLRMSLDPLLRPHTGHVTYLLAVCVTAWLAGLGPALVTTVLGAVGSAALFMGPLNSQLYGVSAWAHVLYLAAAATIALLIDSQQRAKRLAEERLEKLQNAERFQERQRQRLDSTVESVPGVVWEATGKPDDPAQRIEFVSGYVETLLGYSVQQWLTTPNFWLQVVHPEDQERAAREAAEIFAGRQPGRSEFRWVAKDGRVVWVEARSSVVRDQAGRPIGMRGVTMDITERKEAEQALREGAANLEAFLESAAQGILAVDSSANIILVNARTEEMFGYSRQELLGRPLDLLLPENAREMHGRHLAEYFREPRARPMSRGLDLVGRRKDGSEFPMEIGLSFMRVGGDVRAVAFMTDVTERKQTEEQLRQTAKLESLGVLAGGVAHDFNNLLTGIIGNASLALDMLPQDGPRELLEQVIVSSERAAGLTRQLLAYAGKGKYVVELVNLSELVGEIVSLLHTSVAKTVELRLELAEGLPLVECDATQIEQLLMNLVINGAEAVGEVPGTVTVRTAAAGGEVFFEVEDTGCGMDEATRAKIFDPFFTTKFLGRGLGLAAALGIVRAHKGEIRVDSAPGRGSRFTVLLPAAEGDAPKPAPPLLRDLSGEGTILVVDDEEVVRRTAKVTLERYGYQVLLANHGPAALQILEKSADEISLVLLDLTMPLMSGEETLARLKRIRPDMPVILSSGFNEAEAVRRFRALDLAGFLQKPYTAMRLAEKVKMVREAGNSSGIDKAETNHVKLVEKREFR